MKYQAEISTTENIDMLYKSLINEIVTTPRAQLDVKKEDNILKIQVSAKDATALRAMINGACKLLTIYEKIQNDTTTNSSGNSTKNNTITNA